VSGHGVVALSMVLRQGPQTAGVTYPYPVVAVDLAEQSEPPLRFTSTLVGVGGEELVAIGTPVQLIWTERNGSPFPVFRVASGESHA
jgi:hypothetical protein